MRSPAPRRHVARAVRSAQRPAPFAAALGLLVASSFVAARGTPARVDARPPAVQADGAAQTQTQAGDALHRPLDQVLDLYVRDGYVYYGALKSDRAKLDRYLASLATVGGYDSWPRERQIALWLNAYDGFVLQTIVTNYPIRGHSTQYPADSLRQVPGAFDRLTHRVAGRSLTLDAIENTVLSTFKDPRVYFAIGRGAVGSGRLRSEAYDAGHLEDQLKEVAAEVVSRPALFAVDQAGKRITVSPIFGWHEADFIAAYGASADPKFGQRSPIERAIVAFALPKLLPDEVDFVNRNEFALSYGTFDWRLNDLATRR